MAKKKTRMSKPKSKNASRATRPKGVKRLVPLSDRVVVRPLSEEELGTTTASGIIIPDTVDKEKPEQGEVIEVGPGKYEDGKLVKLSVKVGDIVMFSKYGYDEIKHGGKNYLIIKEDSILAVIK